MSYNDLWKAIIRPPRDEYSLEELGDNFFTYSGKHYMRTDFTLTSVQEFKIVGSHYEPIENERISPILPCVIYLHGNGSSQVEALNSLFLLTGSMSLVAFDFSGCGRSTGEYISLGWYEQLDLANLIEFLRENRRVGSIGLWGRSMGAVSAILYASENPRGIEALVLDSPFANLREVAMHLANSHTRFVPNFCIKIIFSLIKRSIQKKANFNINKLIPLKNVGQIKIPALIAYSFQDELIPYGQFEDLSNAYGGEKDIIILEGSHNDVRQLEFCKAVGLFFCKHLKVGTLLNDPINVPPHLVTDQMREKVEEYEQTLKKKLDRLNQLESSNDLERSINVVEAAERNYKKIPRSQT